MSHHVVIVESPTKARTISKFLSKEYEIIASIGHVRDLPQSAADIPAKYKGEKWARLGINVEENFAPLYVTIRGKGKIINDIKKKLANADSLILATDEDREGESISWHLTELVKPKVEVRRIVFHEITKNAIQHALEHFRAIDTNLVKAQEARRLLDRLFGYKLSELLWKKISYRLSAGRVQSPGLRLLVERERERCLFQKVSYADIAATFTHADVEFTAKLQKYQEKRIATGSDFSNQGILKKDITHLSAKDCQHIIDRINDAAFTVTDIATKPQQIRPSIPFITSTLQQDANRRLKFTARETMRVAQSLYEQGHITYMRTDSPSLSQQATMAARKYIKDNFDDAYLSEKPRYFASKRKEAQEAHEAIRPAGEQCIHPQKTRLSGKELFLYSLIWERTVASQMSNATKDITSLHLSIQNCIFSASGSVLTFRGFLALYTYSNIEEKQLPTGLTQGSVLHATKLTVEEHETKPPGRYNDASLIKQLETLGIGRPSTYASILNTLIDRKYARRVDQALAPSLMGFAVAQFLEKNFSEYVNYTFTADLENKLDKIAAGQEDFLSYLKTFYLSENGLQHKVLAGESIDSDASQRIFLPTLPEYYELRVGIHGPFVIIHNTEEKENFSLPEDCNPADITEQYLQKLAEIKRREHQPIGQDPETGEHIYCLTGKFGPYVQRGEVSDEQPKPRRAQVPKTVDAHTVSIEMALKLLSIPRSLGIHPELQEEITATIGRFGPYIKCGETSRSLGKNDDVYTITLERAIERLAEPSARQRTKRSSVMKELGVHPKNKKSLGIYEGPYGYYIKMGRKNIRLPDDQKTKEQIDALTLESVLKIIDQ